MRAAILSPLLLRFSAICRFFAVKCSQGRSVFNTCKWGVHRWWGNVTARNRQMTAPRRQLTVRWRQCAATWRHGATKGSTETAGDCKMTAIDRQRQTRTDKDRKWLKMTENDWKWQKMTENDWKWLKMTENDCTFFWVGQSPQLLVWLQSPQFY